MRRYLLVAALALVALTAAAADRDPTQLIGMDIRTVLQSLGAPQQMFTVRGVDESEDNVVFFYPDFTYLFWYKDRVWQVRYDRRSAATVFGITLGMTRDQVQRANPTPMTSAGDSLYFDLQSAPFPLRVRLVFAAAVLSDLYLYRSDF